MVFAALQVLEDCRLALNLLEEEKDLQKFRIHWVASLALVRAVGHVLYNVDGKDLRLRPHIQAAYKEWQQSRQKHEIFWEFIRKERNLILKEYQFNLHPLDQVQLAARFTALNPETGERIQFDEVFPLEDNIYRPALDGFREGNDVRDIYAEAIEWWEVEIDKIIKLSS